MVTIINFEVREGFVIRVCYQTRVLSQENETWILHNIVKQYWIIRQWIICLSVDLYITVIIITWFDAQRHDIWVLMTGDRSDSLQGSSVSIYNLKRSAFPRYPLWNIIVSIGYYSIILIRYRFFFYGTCIILVNHHIFLSGSDMNISCVLHWFSMLVPTQHN